jgi:hypothetical protein
LEGQGIHYSDHAKKSAKYYQSIRQEKQQYRQRGDDKNHLPIRVVLDACYFEKEHTHVGGDVEAHQVHPVSADNLDIHHYSILPNISRATACGGHSNYRLSLIDS